MELNNAGTKDSSNTSSSEEKKSEHEPTKTTTKSNTFMWPQFLTTVSANGQSLDISTSKKATVIISFHETEITLTPDGKITTRKYSPKSIQLNCLSMRTELYPKTKNVNELNPRKRKKN